MSAAAGRLRRARFCLAGLALAACAGEPAWRTEVRMSVPDDGGPPRYGEAPFPGDAWRGADGRLEPVPGLEQVFGRDADLVMAHLARLDGTGVRPLVEFWLTGDLDPASLPALTSELGDAAVLMDIDPSSPARGQVIPTEWRYDPERRVVRGAPQPGAVLRSGTRHAAFLTGDLRDAAGRPLAAAPALERLAGAGSVPARWASTAEALGALAADPQLADRDIAGLTVFTTQRATRTLLAARAALADPARVPAPELDFPDPALIFAGPDGLDALLGVAARFDGGPRDGQERWGLSPGSSPGGLAHESVGVIATGVMTAARFRRADSGTDDPDDETFAAGEDGAPAVQSIDGLPVTFVLPAAPPPEAGYPVAIIGHGLGSSRHAVLTFAEPLTRAGFALVAIDFDGHGSRHDGADRGNNLAGQLPAFAGEADLIDGFGDRTGLSTTFDFLEGLRNFSGARDGIQQSVLDVCQLVALLRRPDLDLAALAGPGGAPRLDTRRIAYLGESFGTIIGGVLAAVEPELDLFVLDVPGAGVVDLAIVSSPGIATLLVPLAAAMYELEGELDRFHPAVALFQSLVDAADPLTYAPHVLRDRLSVGGRALGPRHVIALEVVGDEVIHNQATDAWARAMGLELLRPHLAAPPGVGAVDSPAAGNVADQTAVLVHYSPATHGANWTSEEGALRFVPGFPHPGPEPFPTLPAPQPVENPIYQTLEQVIEVLESHQRGEPPQVRSTHTPR